MDPNTPVNFIAYPPNYTYVPVYDFPPGAAFDFFGYTFPTFTAIAAAGGTQSQQLTIQADSDFEIRRIVYQADLAAAAYVVNAAPVPNYTIQLTDTGAGRNLFNNPAPLSAVAQMGNFVPPVDLPWPKIVARNSTLLCQLTNFDAAAATYNVRILLLGRKIYFPGAQGS
jgi:hypothetical protein